MIEHRVEKHIVITVVERPKEFIALHSLFENNDTSNLIIVCDDTKEMIELAHELRPRFLAHGNETLKVIAVVEKMLQTHKITNGE
jgi:urease accessory protein UreE